MAGSWTLGRADRSQSLLGWRLWRERSGGLTSWGIEYVWEPGPNQASCLSTRDCPRSPGYDCLCGFWGLFSPRLALERARADRGERGSVLGLIRAWGEVAIHGEEGFRAEHAAVVCLFSDWPWPPRRLALPTNTAGRAIWAFRQLLRLLAWPVPPPSGREEALKLVAGRYQVPLLRLEDALRFSVLREMGANPAMLDEVAAWVSRGQHYRSHMSDGSDV
jgi:hypothetical protein